MSLPIVHYNHPILRKKGAKVTAFNAHLRHLAAAMIETMHAAEGIGLAAQQIGEALQLCVVDLSGVEAKFKWTYDGTHLPLDLFMPLVLVNPEVTPVLAPTDISEEGCLSFPKIRGDVVRPETITVTFQDTAGHDHTLHCNGLLSRCVQHEVDHLNGVLFIDRMTKPSLNDIDLQVKALKKRTRKLAEKS